MVDTSRSERDAAAWEFESSPAHQLRSRGEKGRRGSLKTSGNMQVRILPGVLRTRPDGDGSSLQDCDSGFNSSRVCHVGDAEAVEATVCRTVLTGFESRLPLQSEGAKRRQRFLVPKTSAPEGPGWRFDSSALRHHIAITLKFLLLPVTSLTI